MYLQFLDRDYCFTIKKNGDCFRVGTENYANTFFKAMT